MFGGGQERGKREESKMKVSPLGELSMVFSSLSRNLLARPHQPSIPLSSCAHWFRFFHSPGFYPASLTDWSQHENTPFLLICFHPANRLCTIYTFNFVVDANFYVYVMLSPSLPPPHFPTLLHLSSPVRRTVMRCRHILRCVGKRRVT